MSIDIFFMPCRFGPERVERTDPKTGQIRSVLPNEPLTASELDAVRQVLAEHRVGSVSDPDIYNVQFSDGGRAEIVANDLETGCMVKLRGMTTDVASFLLKLVGAGNWIMIPVMKDYLAITASRDCIKGVPKSFPQIVVCESPEHLWQLMRDGFDSWREYRDRVVGDVGPGSPKG
jgi:hypothetical protein